MKNDIIIFENQEVKLDVNIKDDTVWLNRSQIAKLFDRDIKTIGKHINNALNEELSSDSTVAKFATVEKATNSVVANFATTSSLQSSSTNALFICLPIVFISLSNNSAICFLFNHTVSSFILTSSFTF